MEENLGRMTNTMSYDSCVNPWHYNFVTLFAGYVPWTLLIVLSLFSLTYRKFNIQPAAWWKRFTAWIRIWIRWIYSLSPHRRHLRFLLHSAEQTQRLSDAYLSFHCLFPCQISILSGQEAIQSHQSIWKYSCGNQSVAVHLLHCVKMRVIPETIFHGRHAQDNINFMRAIQNISGAGALLLVAVPTILGIYWWFYQRKHALSNRFLYALVVLTMGLYLALDGAYQPAALNSKSVKFVAAEIEKIAPESEGTMYEFIEESLHAAGDPVHYFEINFYLHNRLDNFYQKRPAKGFLLIGTNDAEKYLPEFEKEGYQFEQVYESPKRVLRQIAKVYKFVKNEQPEKTETTPIVE